MYNQSKKKITKKDYEILSLLIDRPCMKIKELSEKTHVSRVTLRRRVKLYERKKIFKKYLLLNKENLNITLAIIVANFKSIKALESHIKTLRDCPYVLALITNVAQYDLLAIVYGLSHQQTRSFFLNNFYSESIAFKSFVHIPKDALIYPQYVPISIPKKKHCNKDCKTCKFHQDGLCEGCILQSQLLNVLKEEL